jgi:peroxiredoxin
VRRLVVYGVLILAIAAAGLAYFAARRKIVVGRAVVGEPPRQIPREHPILIGEMLPDFSAVDASGHPLGAQQLRGNVAVVSVWATWCQPCRAEMPRLEREVWQKFDHKVPVVGIAIGESAEKVRDFNRDAKFTFPLVPDPKRTVASRFGGDDAIPRTYVINRSGRIIYQRIGYNEREFNHVVRAVNRARSTPGSANQPR